MFFFNNLGIDWTATGQTLTCDVNSGLSCFHTANPRDGCFDYQVKFYCPCDEVEGITYDNTISTPPSAVVVEFLCPEANGLFPDPVNCDHFYHCSNNIPFHKPCAAGTLFHPVLKICDHHGNVQCGQGGKWINLRFIRFSNLHSEMFKRTFFTYRFLIN